MSPTNRIVEPTDAERKLMAMMPPRKSWVGLSGKNRHKPCSDGVHQQKKTTLECNELAIFWTIRKDGRKDVKPPYYKELENFVNRLQWRISQADFRLKEPSVFPIEKDETSCRPLCTFTDLEDAVIVILANKYLSRILDGAFYEESLAFRTTRTYHGMENYVTSHHDAIAAIKAFMKRWDGQQLYVAECDLKKFYDTVSHRVVKDCYTRQMRRIKKDNPGCCFEEIDRVFNAYLDCYSYPKQILVKNKDTTFWFENRIEEKKRCFQWVEKDLIEKGLCTGERGLVKMRIGVPQGGALSGLIANLVLNTVDWQIAGKLTGRDLYIRYCDDMIILSTNRIRCRQLYKTYNNGTKKLRLMPHAAKLDLNFGKKEYWEHKSKLAYPWVMGRKDGQEWIGFVGYEMRRDGMIRIRKKSFEKEMAKQRKVSFEKVLDKIDWRERVSDDSILGTIQSKLISMSVGKVNMRNYRWVDGEMCWTYGFQQLEVNPYVRRQLHALDRHRNQMIRAVEKRLQKMTMPERKVVRRDNEQLEGDMKDYNGLPFSYYYQFARRK